MWFLRSIYQKRFSAFKRDTEEEAFSIPVSIGFPSYRLDHVVDSINPSGRDAGLGIIDDANKMLAYRVTEGDDHRHSALHCKSHP